MPESRLPISVHHGSAKYEGSPVATSKYHGNSGYHRSFDCSSCPAAIIIRIWYEEEVEERRRSRNAEAKMR